MILKYCPSRN